MKKGKIFFHPIEGCGSLSISWSSMPKGDAVEALVGEGVGFFSDKDDLLCVIFDEVREDKDHQLLEFKKYIVEVFVKGGDVTYEVQGKGEKQKTTLKKTPRRKRQTSSK